MLIIGLTGGIGMGKSTTAKMFEEEGIPVWDADAAVHRLYSPGGAAVAPVLQRFPSAGSEEEGIDRTRLSRILMAEKGGLADLEAIVHPLVQADREAFLAAHEAAGTEAVLLDIPLLLEGGGKHSVDLVVVVSAPEEHRKARVMERPGMSEEKYAAITSRQMSDAEKRKHAHHVVPTHLGLDPAREKVREIVAALNEAAEE